MPADYDRFATLAAEIREALGASALELAEGDADLARVIELAETDPRALSARDLGWVSGFLTARASGRAIRDPSFGLRAIGNELRAAAGMHSA